MIQKVWKDSHLWVIEKEELQSVGFEILVCVSCVRSVLGKVCVTPEQVEEDSAVKKFLLSLPACMWPSIKKTSVM